MKKTISSAIALASATSMSSGALLVGSDIGVLSFGTPVNLTGDTATGANNATLYDGLTNPTGNWGNEIVYQFSVSSPGVLSGTLNSASGDPDFFLLSGTSTGTDAGTSKPTALEAVSFAFLDGAGAESFGLLSPGTYYLSVDSFNGFDGSVTAVDTTFDLDILFSEIVAPTSTPLGILGNSSTTLTFSTLGSNYDTEIGIFNSLGQLLDTNDDFEGGLQSQLSGTFAEGDYYLAVGGYNTTFDDNFTVVGGDDAGDLVLTYDGGTELATTVSGEIVFYSFSVVPEPAVAFLALAGLPLAFLRRRNSR